MGAKSNTAKLKLVQETNQPVLLFGEQGRLRGNLLFKNNSASTQSLKSIPIGNVKIRDPANEPLSNLKVRGRLAAKEQGRLRVDYLIDPATAPGTYSATLLVGGVEQPAEINIAAHVELDVEPDTVTINTQQESLLSATFSFSNIGNVDVVLGDKLVIPLKADKSLETSLQQSFAELLASDEEDIKLRDVVSALARNLPGPVTAAIGKTTIKPGEVKQIQVNFELPDNLLAHRYYFADIELYSAGIRLDIYT